MGIYLLFFWFFSLISTIRSSDQFCLTNGCTRAASNLINSIDPSIDPCEDFFEFACGGYRKKNPIIDGRGHEVMDGLDDRALGLLQEFLTEVPHNESADLADKIAAKTFQLCMDLNNGGIKQVLPEIEGMGGFPFQDRKLPSWKDFIQSQGMTPFIDPESDQNDPYTLEIGTGLYIMYLDFAPILAYKLKLTEMIAEDLKIPFSKEKATKRIKNYIDFMQLIRRAYEFDQARAIANVSENSWIQEMTIQQLDQFFPFYNLGQMVAMSLPKANNATKVTVKTNHASYLKTLMEVLRSKQYDVAMIDFLLDSMIEMNGLVFFGSKYIHLQEDMLGWHRSLALHCSVGLQMYHPRWIDAFYMRHVNKEKDFGELLKVAENIKASYLKLLAGEKWLSEKSRKNVAVFVKDMEFFIGAQTKVWSQEKLNSFYKTYTPANASTWSEYIEAAEKFQPDSRFPDAKDFPSVVVNAGYHNGRFVIDMGIIQEPIYAWDYPLELQYGGMGMVVGHETTHGIGPSLINSSWVSSKEFKTYEDKIECVSEHYENYSMPMEDGKEQVQQFGHLTWDEAVSDLMGLRTAYRAYHQARNQLYGSSPPKLPGLLQYTNDQLFFMGYASINCQNPSDTDLWGQHYDGHPFNKVRVNENAMNSHDFAEAFKCPADSPMNPSKKCQVWRRRRI